LGVAPVWVSTNHGWMAQIVFSILLNGTLSFWLNGKQKCLSFASRVDAESVEENEHQPVGGNEADGPSDCSEI
jgi:hypothetical protein